MSDRAFLDTNIFVYSFDKSAAAKQERARELITRGLQDGSAVVSYQVVQEFFQVALNRFEDPMTIEECHEYLGAVLAPLCQVFPDADFYRKGLDLKRVSGFSYYDALILAAAIRGGCRRLLTEDMQDGREIEGLRIVNPFR